MSVFGFVVMFLVNYGLVLFLICGIGGVNGGGNVFVDELVVVYVDDVYVVCFCFLIVDLIDFGGIEVLWGL